MRETKEQKMARLERQKAEKEEEIKQLRKKNRSLLSEIKKLSRENNESIDVTKTISTENTIIEHFPLESTQSKKQISTHPNICVSWWEDRVSDETISKIIGVFDGMCMRRDEEIERHEMLFDLKQKTQCTIRFRYNRDVDIKFFLYLLISIVRNMAKEEERNYLNCWDEVA